DPREGVVPPEPELAAAAGDGHGALEVRRVPQERRDRLEGRAGQHPPARLLHGGVVEEEADARWRQHERNKCRGTIRIDQPRVYPPCIARRLRPPAPGGEV